MRLLVGAMRLLDGAIRLLDGAMRLLVGAMRLLDGAFGTLAGARRASAILAAVAVGFLAASGPLHQLGVLSLDAAYTGLRWAVYLGTVAAVTGIGTAAVACRRRHWPTVAVGVLAVAAALAAIAVPLRARARAQSAPPIHDVTTDLDDPPMFKVLADLPDGRSRDLTRGARLNELQRRAYPDIAPLVVPTSPEMAFEEALETLSELEWQVEDGSEEEGRIEATARSPWFGFKDDLVVRLTASGAGTRVDIRSVARDEGSDMGRNAEHVREFLSEMRR